MTTLLTGVNAVLKTVNIVQGDSGELGTLSDGARQNWIDNAVQAWQVAVDALYAEADQTLPEALAESTITLVTSDRDYALASDLVTLIWPLIDKTNSDKIYEMKPDGLQSGYERILDLDPEQDDDGLAQYAAISPVNGQLYLDRLPTATYNGRVFTYQYHKVLTLDEAADTFPFSDQVYQALIPCAVEVWKREERNDFDDGYYQYNLARAAKYLSQRKLRTSYNTRRR